MRTNGFVPKIFGKNFIVYKEKLKLPEKHEITISTNKYLLSINGLWYRESKIFIRNSGDAKKKEAMVALHLYCGRHFYLKSVTTQAVCVKTADKIRNILLFVNRLIL